MADAQSVKIVPAPTGSEAPVIPVVQADRPKWLPEKFKTAEDMANSYRELEAKVGKPATSETQVTPPVVVPPIPTVPSLDKFEQEFSTSGKLSEQSYTDLAVQGFTKDIVDKYISGRSALVSNQMSAARDAIYNTSGGEDNYKQMVSWASQSLPPAAREAYNATLNGGNIEATRFAVAGLKAQFEAANGRDPALRSGHGTSTGMQPFRSNAEMVSAMKDPKYANDPAYRKDVENRLSVSFNT